MKITLVSHASVIIESRGVRIWTDPWLLGKAFNDSWSLFPEPAWDPAWLDEIGYIWISHEHPDHFHIPTLRSLPAAFKTRVTVLFQENNSDKMFEAFARLGFTHTMVLPHRKTTELPDGPRIYCYQEGAMNSCLAVIEGNETVVNVNDAEIRTADCKLIRKDIGPVSVVLNQFSIAGYSGLPDPDVHLPRMAGAILDNILANHRDLQARVTIPFASFIYFSASDNRYINAYANTPRRVFDHFAKAGERVAVLWPGDVFDRSGYDPTDAALLKYDSLHARLDEQPYDAAPVVPLDALSAAFSRLCETLAERYPAPVLSLLRPVTISVRDLDQTVRMSIPERTLLPAPGAAADLVINSQPLSFALQHPYGVQTLGVSARYQLLRNRRNWQLHRILFSLNNAEIYLRPGRLLTPRNLAFFRQRLRGSAGQLVRRLRTMM